MPHAVWERWVLWSVVLLALLPLLRNQRFRVSVFFSPPGHSTAGETGFRVEGLLQSAHQVANNGGMRGRTP